MSIKRILVVDDSPTERHIMASELSQAGFDVSTAIDGEDAILKAKMLQPELIMMDVVMPGLNGFQATRTISRDQETRHIPIIICSSKSQETDRIWGLRQGAKDYVSKPVVIADLIERIQRLS